MAADNKGFRTNSVYLTARTCLCHPLVLAAVLVLNISVLALEFGPWRGNLTLRPAGIALDQGFAFRAPLAFDVVQPFAVRNDRIQFQRTSSLTVQEDGKYLGPARGWIETIRLRGEGRYAFRKGALYFSTLDGSDPRINGRTYSIQYVISLSMPFVAVILLLDLALVFLSWNNLTSWVVRQPVAASLVTAFAIMALLAAILTGIGIPISPAQGPPADAALLRDILWHAVIGLLFSAVWFLSAAGLYVGFSRNRGASLLRLVYFGYPLALIFSAVLSVVALTMPYGGAIALALLPISMLPLMWWRGDRVALKRVLGTLGLCLPLALAFIVTMGLLWHGPTDTLAAALLGDMVYYVAMAKSIAVQFHPFLNLGTIDYTFHYFNKLPPMIAAALAPIPGFDPFLFFAVVLPLFSIVSLVFCLTLLPETNDCSERRKPWSSSNLILLILLLVAANRYPSWLVESPPVVFAIPIVFSVYVIFLQAKGNLMGLSKALAVALVGSALSKVVSLVVLGAFVAQGSLIAVLRSKRRMLQYLFALLAGVTAVYATAMLVNLWPSYGNIALMTAGPESWTALSSGNPFKFLVYFVRDFGLLLLGFAALGLGNKAVTIALWVGILAFMALPFIFLVTFVVAILLVFCGFAAEPQAAEKSKWPIGTAVVLLLASTLLLDPGGVQVGLVYGICMVSIAWFALSRAPDPSGSVGWHEPRLQKAISAGAALAVAIAISSIAFGTATLDPNRRHMAEGELTPSVHDIWMRVAQRTPRNALIFTDQTGADWSLIGGWNMYGFFGERQIYVAYTTDTDMRLKPARRDQLLASNRAVLAGSRSPKDLPLARTYGSYFAVVDRTRPVPRYFHPVYNNSHYSIYEITGQTP